MSIVLGVMPFFFLLKIFLIEWICYVFINNSPYLNEWFCIVVVVFFSVGQYLKNDLMRQFDSQVNDFVDSLIEESATLEPAPLPAVFSPPLSDKERIKLRCCHSTRLGSVFFFLLLSGKNDWCHCLFFAGIFDLLTAKASSLSVAGPSWSKSAGASEGTDAAVFPLEESV